MVVYVLRSARQCGLRADGVPPLSAESHNPWQKVPQRWPPAPMNGPRYSVLQDPCPRTVSPQPVSSTRRRLSTDEMQLREVGKLAAHPRKMQWLQRPGRRDRSGAAWCCGERVPLGSPGGLGRPGRPGGASSASRPRRPSTDRGPPSPVVPPVLASAWRGSRGPGAARPPRPPSGPHGTVAVQGNLTV